ncbi:MAG: YidC/Oxa1 family membrane protein insertase [Candidatus Nomurabacteria bacterium]|nr:YidC/Oxa1 family membrane protein insertase [Candidatus Nomurabacteria bacterium]
MLNIWNTLLYKPLLNLLAVIVSVVPGGDVGVAVIILTLLVKTILIPLSRRSIESQAKMKLLEPEIAKVKASGASKEEQAKQTFELYKKYKTNPFSGCLLVLIQIPIIFALYYVFLRFNQGTGFDTAFLYSFVKNPVHINNMFIGLLDISKPSLLLAILAGASQFLQAHYMPKPPVSEKKDGPKSFQDSFASSMQMQMKYIFPFLIIIIAYKISGAIALYWITSNMFTVFQQIHVNRKKISLAVEVK